MMRKIANEELGRPSAEEFARMEKMPVVVVLDNIRSLNNVGSFFRTADAFGVARIVLCGITARPPHREIHKTALGAEETVPWEACERITDALAKLRREGCRILAVEQVTESTMLDRFTPDPGVRYALVFGNEVFGVSEEALPFCDGALEIPQVGTKHSLNVAVSGGVVLWNFFCDSRKRALTLAADNQQ